MAAAGPAPPATGQAVTVNPARFAAFRLLGYGQATRLAELREAMDRSAATMAALRQASERAEQFAAAFRALGWRPR